MMTRHDKSSWGLLLALFAAGCGNGDAASEGPTYYQDVAPLLAEHCWSCHSEGKVASIVLDRYETARDSARAIAAATAAGRMPPWYVDDSGACQTFRDGRSLDQEEIDLLAAWADAGAPAGPEEALPRARALPRLQSATLTLDPGETYTPQAALDDDYRCFVIDPQIDSDRFLTGYEVHPDRQAQVHHVVLYSVDSAEEAALAAQLDQADPGPGYTCFGGSGTGADRSLAVWAPGTGATHYPEGTGLRLKGGFPVIMQVHYNTGHEPDRTTVDLALAESVANEAFITGTVDPSLALTPGMAEVVESAALPVPPLAVPMRVWGAYPHMHRYGRQIRVEYDRDGDSTCLVNVPDYDFNWQQFYFYEEPVIITPPGSGYLRIECVYDTRGATSLVTWGEGTGDEMCVAGLYATF